jgi:hypothetical protein
MAEKAKGDSGNIGDEYSDSNQYAETKSYRTIPSEVGQEDCQEIEASVARSLKKRKEAVALLQTIEEAWKTGVCQELWTRSEETKNDPEDVAKVHNDPISLIEAQNKKKEVDTLQKKIFLSFKPLTSAKHEEQLSLGQEILDSLPTSNLEAMVIITEKTQRFFSNESHINKLFLNEIEKISSRTKTYLEEIKGVESLKCQDVTLDAILNQDLKTLKGFLKATQKLFNG